MQEPSTAPVRIVGRYALYGELASGGMATVHLGRLLGPVGFSRTVAIKRLHEQFARDPDFVSMFLDEARLCARIRHPNVVPTLDVIAGDRQLLLVMEYVQGESLSRLQRAAAARKERLPLKVAVAILSGVLHGLHAAHEAKDERGQPLGIVHRDVSPQNVLVGADGVARVLDFGIAKAKGRLYTTQDGRVKGKLAYMAPEQLRSETVDRKSDIFAASIMAWELVTGRRLFEGESEGATVTKVLLDPIPAPSSALSGAEAAAATPLDSIVMRGLEREPAKRFDTASEMATLLEEAVHPATSAQVGRWIESVATEALQLRTARVQEVESGLSDTRQHLDEVINKLTSDSDVTKTQEVPSGTGNVIASPSPSSSSALDPPGEAATKAHLAVSRSDIVPVSTRNPWPRRAAWALAIGALGAAAFVARSRPSSSQNASQATAKPAAEPAPAASAATKAPPATRPGEPEPVSSAAAANAPSSTVAANPADSAPAVSSVATVQSVPAPSAARPRGHAGPKPASSVDCRDPYTRDSLGRKIYKLECL